MTTALNYMGALHLLAISHYDLDSSLESGQPGQHKVKKTRGNLRQPTACLS